MSGYNKYLIDSDIIQYLLLHPKSSLKELFLNTNHSIPSIRNCLKRLKGKERLEIYKESTIGNKKLYKLKD